MHKRPNIVFIIHDDTSPCWVGYRGGCVLTPNIDSIAHQGVSAERFYTCAPVCTPSRYTWITGHFPGRCPHESLYRRGGENDPHWLSFNTTYDPTLEQGFGQLLQASGYRTGFVGKWHTGGLTFDRSQYHADDDLADPEVDRKLKADYARLQDFVRSCGFDYADGIFWGNPDDRPIRAMQTHNLNWMARCALDFLDDAGASADAGGQPFFLNVATSTLHGPHHLDSLYADQRITQAGLVDGPHINTLPNRRTIPQRLEKAGLPVNHINAGALWHDDLVGAVLQKLEALGLSENTIVIDSADHGNENWGKFTLHEGGSHIPFAMKWPGRIKPGTKTSALMCNADFVATLMDIVGGDTPKTQPSDGRSMLPWLLNEADDAGREEIFTEFGYSRAVTTRRWKYIARRMPASQVEDMKQGRTALAYDVSGNNYGNQMLSIKSYPGYWDLDELYDLQRDPREQNNLAYNPDFAGIRRDMRERLRRYTDTFARPFHLDPIDPWLLGTEHRALCEKTADAVDPYEMEWYLRDAF